MKTAFHSLTLLVIFGLILTSCSPAAPATEAVVPLQVQATATADHSNAVSVELTVQYDTAAVYNTVGQIVRFKYIVKMVKNDLTDNTPANVTISGITAICPPLNTISNLNDRFDPGEVLECTGDYLLTQADLDKGSVSNVATAMAYTVHSNTVTTNVPTVSARALTLTKTANPASYSAANQQITFTYTIKNSGTSQLGPAQFTVTDSIINNNAPFNCGNADATIAPGATLTCTATYTVTTNDMNAAAITSSAATSGGGANPSQPISLSLAKAAVTPTNASGGTIQHTVRDGEWLWQIARCYGADPQKTVEANPTVNPTLLKAGMVVNVAGVGSKGTIYIKSPSDLCVKFHTVQSGDTWTSIAQLYGADPGLTQMVNANILTVGKQVKVPLYTAGLNIPLVTTSATAVPSTSALTLTVTPSTTTYSQADQIITFNYTIKNNGTTTLGPTQFVVTDAFMTPSTLNCGPAGTTLASGQSTTCSNTYKISQADMSAANIQFSTTASGSGAPNSPAVATTLTKGTAQIGLSVTPSPATYTQANQIITLNFVIKNTGTTSLGPTQFTVTSSFLTPATFNCGAANITLAAGAEVTCSAGYTITQVDLGAANIQFSASATGGGVTSQAAPATVTKQ